MTLLSYVAMSLSIIGNLFVNRKRVTGMWLWLIGSLLWVVFAWHSRTWSQVGMFGVYTILNVEGVLKWRK